MLCSTAKAQTFGTLQSSILSCTRSSVALGFAVLAACFESKLEVSDGLVYYVSANCSLCPGNKTLIQIDSLRLGIGLWIRAGQTRSEQLVVKQITSAGGIFGSPALGIVSHPRELRVCEPFGSHLHLLGT